uniref:Uncharacterized protein n=1 Tax=Anguilla anguilla TaxID=7936 RepID=A0A0E9PPL0_ANGAN
MRKKAIPFVNRLAHLLHFLVREHLEMYCKTGLEHPKALL